MDSGFLNPKYIAFDGDDTLWKNEHLFVETESAFCDILESAGLTNREVISRTLFQQELENLPLYGYGIKGFTLSMIETALKLGEDRIQPQTVLQILKLGKRQLGCPVELIDGVKGVLEVLHQRYPLVLATKGDLLDQERKLSRSGLAPYFAHVEVMSEKKKDNYRSLLNRLQCKPAEFLMIGNSVKSDILPVLDIGGSAIHIPFFTTWQHEVSENPVDRPNYLRLNKIGSVLSCIQPDDSNGIGS